MTYRKHMTADGYRMVLVYDSGREQDVSNDQDLLQQWLAAGNVPEEVPYVPPPVSPTPLPDPEIDAFRRKYLDTTAALCQLAGEPYTGKLANTDYERVALAAASNTLAGVLVATLVYCRTVLRELDGVNWFDNITGV